MKIFNLGCGCEVDAIAGVSIMPEPENEVVEVSVMCSHNKPLEWVKVSSLIPTESVPFSVAMATAIEAVIAESEGRAHDWTPHLSKNLFRFPDGLTACLWVESPVTMKILWGQCPNSVSPDWHFAIDAVEWAMGALTSRRGNSSAGFLGMIPFD